MSKKTKIPELAVLCLLFCGCLTGCGMRPLFRYNQLQMRGFIPMIITDRFTDLKKIEYVAGVDFLEGGTDIWEVTLPDRGGLTVHFYSSIRRITPVQGMGRASWHRYIETDYVGQVLAAADQTGKNEIDARFGMLPDTTEVVYDRSGDVDLYVHTAAGLDEFSDDRIVDYIKACLEYYDLGVQPAGTPDEAAYYGVEKLSFVIVYDAVTDASADGPFEDDLVLVSDSLSNFGLRGDGRAFEEDWVRLQHRQHIARFKHDNGLEKKITDEQALSAIRKYCETNNPDLAGIVQDGAYAVYWDVEAGTDFEIVVLFRSYTGAQIRYYIDRLTGDTRVTESVPGITDGEEPSDETLNVWDYLE
ncbi:MAG: hypothetical protein K6G16_11875 [Lachnospiraceae bacterium]|nr:hypothetical protein [Lachnospiraceae bacterium]